MSQLNPCRAAAGIAFAVFLCAAAPPQAPALAQAQAPVVLDKDLEKELGKGGLLKQLETRRKFPKAAYSPSAAMMKPFASAAVGAPVAYELVQGTPFANAPQAQLLSQRIVDRMLAEWPGPKAPVPVYVVADPYYHAEARPSGIILVSLGVFNQDASKGVANVDELAMLLGHELAHVLLGHLDDAKLMNGVARALSFSANSFLLYSQVSKSTYTGNQFHAAGDPKLVRRSLIGNLATRTLVEDLLNPGFARGKELEADRLGIDLARRAHFGVTENQTRTFIDRHIEDDMRHSRQMDALGIVVSALIREAAQKAALKAGGGLADPASKLTAMLGDKVIKVTMDAISTYTKRHPDPEERKTFAGRYFAANYPDEPTDKDGRLLKHDVLAVRAVSGSGQTVSLLAHVKSADDVRTQLPSTLSDATGGETDRAVFTLLKSAGFATSVAVVPIEKAKGKKTKKGSVVPPSRPAVMAGFADDDAGFTSEMQGVLQELGGNDAGAQQSWRQGLKFNLPSVELAKRFGGVAPVGAELQSVVARYGQILGTTDPLLDLVVAEAVTRQDVSAAELAAAKCVTYEGGSLYPRCVRSLGYDPLNKETPAKSDEGKKAFLKKSFEKSFQGLSAITDMF